MAHGMLIVTADPAPRPSSSFLSLLEAHEELDELFLRHQQALLRRDLAGARWYLEAYERGLREHIRLEEEDLLPIYERAGPIRGGAPRLFTAEHRKMLQMVGRCRDRLEELEQQRGDVSRELLQFLDYETMFKHLSEHHDLRERNILYPTLDRVAGVEERDALLASPAAIPAAADLPEPAGEGYRSYLRAAVLICLIAGAALGTLNLTWLVSWATTGMMPRWMWWPALLQAHGDAQLFGWTGLFIMGIATHLLPRLLQRPAAAPWLTRAIFGLVLGGLVIALFAQPLSVLPRFGAVFAGSMVLQWAGVSLFTCFMLCTVRWPRRPDLALILSGTLWFWLGATARLGLSVLTVAFGQAALPRAGDAAFLQAMTWGFLVACILGFSLRLLPGLIRLPEGDSESAWIALLLLTAGTMGEVWARWTGLAGLSVAAMALTLVGAVYGAGALPLWAFGQPARDPSAAWLLHFARTAYAWLLVSGMLLLWLRLSELLTPLAPLDQHAVGGASRHALTVGFASLMIVGMAWRLLPSFTGRSRTRPALVAAVYGLLLTGCLLRVAGQVGAGLAGGAWYAAMGSSGWLELTGITLFTIDTLRLLRR